MYLNVDTKSPRISAGPAVEKRGASLQANSGEVRNLNTSKVFGCGRLDHFVSERETVLQAKILV
jgi:hypothetical protein